MSDWDSAQTAFEEALAHEEFITKHINELTDLAIAERDHSTKTFLQWYVDEQVEEEAVANEIPGVKVSVNPDAVPDKRSYMVNFDLYKELAPDHQPIHDLQTTILEIRDNLTEMNFNDPDFRTSGLIRLQVLNGLQESGLVNDNLDWKWNNK